MHWWRYSIWFCSSSLKRTHTLFRRFRQVTRLLDHEHPRLDKWPGSWHCDIIKYHGNERIPCFTWNGSCNYLKESHERGSCFSSNSSIRIKTRRVRITGAEETESDSPHHAQLNIIPTSKKIVMIYTCDSIFRVITSKASPLSTDLSSIYCRWIRHLSSRLRGRRWLCRPREPSPSTTSCTIRRSHCAACDRPPPTTSTSRPATGTAGTPSPTRSTSPHSPKEKVLFIFPTI